MPNPHPTIEILLATYNGAAYLAAQLDSILAQDDPGWRLLVRDGGSRDGTAALLADYQARHPDRIAILPGGTATACENFAALLTASTAELVMLCDQDDIWFADKISRSVRAAGQLTAQYGAATPILVFTDKQVVDDSLRLLAPSDFRYQHLSAAVMPLPRLLLQNNASGCTMLCNRALLDRALPVPAAAVMHDHWLMLCAVATGRCGVVPEPTMLYRQHGHNVLGAAAYGNGYFRRRLQGGWAAIRRRQLANVRQAAALLDRCSAALTPDACRMLEEFSALPERGWLARRRILWRYGIWKTGFRRNLGLFLLI